MRFQGPSRGAHSTWASRLASATGFACLLAVGPGCDLDFDEFVVATDFRVSPAFICPWESAELSWSIPKEDHCPGGTVTTGGPVPRCSSLTSLTSSPPGGIAPPVAPGPYSAEGSRSVSVPGTTTFTLLAEVCDDSACTSPAALETTLEVVPGSGTLRRVFAGGCSGATPVHAPVDLSRLSPCLSIGTVCTVASNPGPIRVSSRDGSLAPVILGPPGPACTDAFAGGGKVLDASPLFALDPTLCGSLETSGPPPDLAIDVTLECADAASCAP